MRLSLDIVVIIIIVILLSYCGFFHKYRARTGHVRQIKVQSETHFHAQAGDGLQGDKTMYEGEGKVWTDKVLLFWA